MSTPYLTPTRRFGVGMNLLVVVTLFALFLGGLGLAVGLKRGDWTIFAIVVVVIVMMAVMLSVLRLEFSRSGFFYRNISGSTSVAWSNVTGATVQVVHHGKSPRGVAVFWITLRSGPPLKVNLRTFPVEAAAILFSSIEAQGIAIEVPNDTAARRMVDQVRAAQGKRRMTGR
jgi:hypothetical protein